jgi:presenilin-like A22 family membrane protease
VARARRSSRSFAPRPRHDLVGLGLVAFGLYNLALSLFMVVAPGAFYSLIGPFGPRNDHYIRDNATFGLALGVATLIAVRLERWRVPVLVILAVQFTLHAVNHLVDIGTAHPVSAGPVDFALITLGALLAALLALRAWSEERPG